MALPKINAFELAKVDFKAETGLEWKDNLSLYLSYLNYRMQVDISWQLKEIDGKLNVIQIESPKTREGIYQLLDKFKRQ